LCVWYSTRFIATFFVQYIELIKETHPFTIRNIFRY